MLQSDPFPAISPLFFNLQEGNIEEVQEGETTAIISEISKTNLSHDLSTLKHVKLCSSFLSTQLRLLQKLLPKTLETLDLSDIRRSYAVLNLIPAFITSLPNLKSISFRDLELGNEIIAKIAPALERLNYLEVLDVSGNHLSSTNILAMMLEPHKSTLKSLDLSNTALDFNGMPKLAEVLAKMTNLRSLNLSSNRLQAGDVEVVVGALEHVRTLEVFVVSDNHIGSFADDLVLGLRKLVNLKYLDLSKNSLRHNYGSIASALEALTNLKFLNLGSCELEEDGMQSMAPVLSKLTRLQSLNLSMNFNNRSLREYGRPQAITQILVNLSDLQILDLSGLGLNEKAVAVIAPFLERLTKLTQLNLKVNNLWRSTLLVPVFEKLTSLVHLDLCKTGMNSNALKTFSPALRLLTCLETLDLSGNSITNDKEGIEFGAPALGTLHRLKSLNLGRVILGGKGMEILEPNLQKLINLEKLALFNCDIGAIGTTSLSSALAPLTKLKELDLSSNYFYSQQASMYLIPTLASLLFLEILHLEDNFLGIDGASALSKVLPKLTRLRELHLGFNRLGAYGVFQVVTGVKDLKHLKVLDLSSNGCGDRGAIEIAPWIAKMTCLRKLDLDNNDISLEGVKTLAFQLVEPEMALVILGKCGKYLETCRTRLELVSLLCALRRCPQFGASTSFRLLSLDLVKAIVLKLLLMK